MSKATTIHATSGPTVPSVPGGRKPFETNSANIRVGQSLRWKNGMMHLEDGFHIFTNGVFNPIGPRDDNERAYLESLISTDYERCHPGETLEDLKRRARFSKEDRGLLYDWMAVAARRAIAQRNEKAIIGLHIAA